MLDKKWVDEIFRRLSIRYGRDFSAKYENLNVEDVKLDWAQYLGGFADMPEAIQYAFNNLPESKPPNVAEFANICRRAPRKELIALPHNETPEEKQRAAEQLKKLKEMLGAKSS